MKKALIVVLALVLLLAALFFWKGGHHAIAVSEALEEWLDADQADQSLTLQLQKGGFYVDSTSGQLKPKVDQWILTADTFWTEYGDDEIYGLSAGGITAYLRRGVLYMDTGRAYTLPESPEMKSTLRRLATGLLLYGRMTKNGNTYSLSMKTEELELYGSVTMEHTISSMSLSAVLPDGMSMRASLTPKAAMPHSIPQSVADAIVLAKMERPMSLSEPLEVLLPALENLLPLTGKLELGIASGILKLNETVDLSMDSERICISRSGIQADLPLDLSGFSPAALGLLALRNGTFSCQGEVSSISLSIPGDATGQLTEALVPQAAGLDITFGESLLMLTIAGGRVTQASITANGSVPFLFTDIPLTFTANLQIT